MSDPGIGPHAPASLSVSGEGVYHILPQPGGVDGNTAALALDVGTLHLEEAVHGGRGSNLNGELGVFIAIQLDRDQT